VNFVGVFLRLSALRPTPPPTETPCYAPWLTTGAVNRIDGAVPAEGKPDYQQEAKRIRAKARETRDEEAREQLLLVALLYDQLAKHMPLALNAKMPDDTFSEDPPESTDSA